MKDLYVHGIVKDYDKSINSLNKYLFSENERLNAIIDELEEKIDKAIEYIKKYQEIQAKYCYVDFDNEDIDKLLEILGGDSDGM